MYEVSVVVIVFIIDFWHCVMFLFLDGLGMIER